MANNPPYCIFKGEGFCTFPVSCFRDKLCRRNNNGFPGWETPPSQSEKLENIEKRVSKLEERVSLLLRFGRMECL